jgi:uncharacterized membrane protein
MGKTKLEKHVPQKPKDFVSHIRSPTVLWYWITLAVSLLTFTAIVLVPENLKPFGFVRYILGASFVFWLPGYCCVKLLFPREVSKRSSKYFEAAEKIALNIGMSIALVTIVGSFIYYISGIVSVINIVLCLIALTVVFATLAVVRDYYLYETSQKNFFKTLFKRIAIQDF